MTTTLTLAGDGRQHAPEPDLQPLEAAAAAWACRLPLADGCASPVPVPFAFLGRLLEDHLAAEHGIDVSDDGAQALLLAALDELDELHGTSVVWRDDDNVAEVLLDPAWGSPTGGYAYRLPDGGLAVLGADLRLHRVVEVADPAGTTVREA